MRCSSPRGVVQTPPNLIFTFAEPIVLPLFDNGELAPREVEEVKALLKDRETPMIGTHSSRVRSVFLSQPTYGAFILSQRVLYFVGLAYI